MLFEASTTYAAGEPHGDVGHSQYQNMSQLGRYDIAEAVKSPNVWVGLAGILALLWIGHKTLGGKRK